MTGRISIDASEYFDPRADVIHSALSLATSVLRITTAGTPVLLSFESVRGVASTFFNTLFAELLDKLGREQFETLIDCKYGSRVQEDAAKRSLDAVLGDAA